MPDRSVPPFDFNKATEDFSNTLKDVAYVAIGLGVLGFQRAQVQRVELTKQLETWLGELPDVSDLGRQFVDGNQAIEDQLATARVQLLQLAKAVDERLQPVRAQLDDQVDHLEQHLPPGARTLVQSVRAAAAEPEQRWRTIAGLD